MSNNKQSLKDNVFLGLAMFFYLVFAYDIENDRDFYTWLWLLIAILDYTIYLKINRQNEQQ